jgi:hypothetical protein
VEYLSLATMGLPSDYSISEELAAAYILGGDYRSANPLLEAIPANQISAAGKAAQSFVRSKVRGIH